MFSKISSIYYLVNKSLQLINDLSHLGATEHKTYCWSIDFTVLSYQVPSSAFAATGPEKKDLKYRHWNGHTCFSRLVLFSTVPTFVSHFSFVDVWKFLLFYPKFFYLFIFDKPQPFCFFLTHPLIFLNFQTFYFF